MRLDNVVKHFPIRGGVLLRQVDSVKAVNGVSFDIREGETFGLVGESGCGKSTLGSVVLGLDAPTSGSVTFDGKDVHKARGAQRRDLHRQMQVVFQDPFESLNPRMTVEEIVGEGLRIHGGLSKEEIHDRVMEMLARVGLEPGHARRYPHEFSGGQRQYGYTYLFVAHGLNVVRYMSDRVGVMYLGKIVELADTDDIFRQPLHPYTQALLDAIPDVDKGEDVFSHVLSGDVPSPVHLPSGCPFHPRCPKATDKCRTVAPEMRRVGAAQVMCHLYD